MLYAFGMPGPTEMLILAGIVVLLFGANALPKLARNAGKVLPSFKAGMQEVNKEVEEMKNTAKNIAKNTEEAIKS